GRRCRWRAWRGRRPTSRPRCARWSSRARRGYHRCGCRRDRPSVPASPTTGRRRRTWRRWWRAWRVTACRLEGEDEADRGLGHVGVFVDGEEWILEVGDLEDQALVLGAGADMEEVEIHAEAVVDRAPGLRFGGDGGGAAGMEVYNAATAQDERLQESQEARRGDDLVHDTLLHVGLDQVVGRGSAAGGGRGEVALAVAGVSVLDFEGLPGIEVHPVADEQAGGVGGEVRGGGVVGAASEHAGHLGGKLGALEVGGAGLSPGTGSK